MTDSLVYFELNDWFPGRDCPNAQPFLDYCEGDRSNENGKWVWHEPLMRREEWVKENQLVVTFGNVDMSMNFSIIAKRSWVEKNCPELLTKYTEFLCDDPNNPDCKKEPRLPFWDNPTDYGVHYFDEYDWDWYDPDEESEDEEEED